MKDKGFFLEIITKEKVKFKGDINYLRLPGWEGEMGILKGHAPLIALLAPGECQIRYDTKDSYMVLGDGFVKVQDDRALVIVSFAQEPDEIDIEESRRVLKEEEDYLKSQAKEIPEFDLHRLRLLRAKACLRVASERKM